MRKDTLALIVIFLGLFDFPAYAACSRFSGSTMQYGGFPSAQWRTDYPSSSKLLLSELPWTSINFETNPKSYMTAVLSTVQPYFKFDGKRLVGTGAEPWWIVEWMDYDSYGREPSMGLTKERGPDPGDLSSISEKGSQIWAVNFYNEIGAAAFAQIFHDRCDPTVLQKTIFPEGTVAVKLLFTDGDLGKFAGQISYLDGAPNYVAAIDPEGASSSPLDPKNRTQGKVQLLQVDFAIKDHGATKTGWVFGTFAWMGPARGDGLFDNLVPVALTWANDKTVTDDQIKESWINTQLKGTLYGWNTRPYLGFFGRGNGPADNIRSSCLSCHATSRIPKSNSGFTDRTFTLSDFGDATKVSAHVAKWFQNILPGDVFDEGNPQAYAALDYSLQLKTSLERMCLACQKGDLNGATPGVCIHTSMYTQPTCGKALSPMASTVEMKIEETLPPRQ